jgi:vancomycin resistance protein YoaR
MPRKKRARKNHQTQPARQSTRTSATPRQRPPARRPARQRSRLAAFVNWLAVLTALLLLLGIGSMLALLLGERAYIGRIYPHISVRGVDVGSADTTAARGKLLQHYEDFLQQPVELVYGEQVWRPSAAELGISLEIDEALRHAVTLGRAETRLDSIRTVAAIWEYGVDLPLRAKIDQQAMQSYLLKVADEVEQSPQNADLHLDGAEVVVTPEEAGTQVLVDATLADMTVALQRLEPQRVALRTRALTPTTRDSDIAPVAAELRDLLEAPLVAYSNADACVVPCRWEWSPEQVARWVLLRRTINESGTTELSVQIDRAALQRELVPIAEILHQDGDLPRVNWNGGNPTIFRPGTPGSGLNATLAQAQLETALLEGPRTVELPMIELPPPVIDTNLASLQINTLIGSGVSSFRNSEQYRITNIQAGARQLHGILVPPGKTFSFNNNLGAVDSSNGFVQGAAIVNNRTQLEWGGGLCQVSTTMFRAAFWTGLPIAERHEHRFRIGWYEELGEPPGLDAAIFTGVSDLRFVNDTGGWVLIQTYVDLAQQQMTIALYGRPVQRQVSMSHRVLERMPAPRRPLYLNDSSLPRGTFKQTDWARPGMHVQVYRTVEDNGQVIRQDTFDTVFEPWPNIYVRGTG